VGYREDPRDGEVKRRLHAGIEVMYYQHRCVYEPAEDTYLMADALIELSRSYNARRILEIGYGSGYLTFLSRKLWESSSIVATDVNPYSMGVHGIFRNDPAITISLCSLDMCIKNGELFDLAYSNPPYIPVEEGELSECDGFLEKSWSCTGSCITDFCRALCERGRVALLLVSTALDTSRVFGCMRHRGCSVEIVKREKLFFEELFVLKGVHKV